MPVPIVDFTNLPGSEGRIPLDLDQGPPAPLNLEPFGPNPWAGGGASVVNVPAGGTSHDFQSSKSIWGIVFILAILLL